MTHTDLIVEVKLSLQRALLGEVTSNVDAVGFCLEGPIVQIKTFFHGEPSPQDLERMYCVGSEVQADLDENLTVEESVGAGRPPFEDDTFFLVFERAIE